jgi:S1-C subfamily serine protease
MASHAHDCNSNSRVQSWVNDKQAAVTAGSITAAVCAVTALTAAHAVASAATSALAYHAQQTAPAAHSHSRPAAAAALLLEETRTLRLPAVQIAVSTE